MSQIVLPTIKRQPVLKGAHVLATLVAFFGTVFAVNGVLVFEALKTHSGVVAQEPYRKGLAYNDRIAADELQTALGWKAAIAFSATSEVVLTLLDRTDKPLIGLEISGSLGRSATERLDAKLSFTETSPGVYAASTAIKDAGDWLITIEARNAAVTGVPSEPIYRLRRKLWRKP